MNPRSSMSSPIRIGLIAAILIAGIPLLLALLSAVFVAFSQPSPVTSAASQTTTLSAFLHPLTTLKGSSVQTQTLQASLSHWLTLPTGSNWQQLAVSYSLPGAVVAALVVIVGWWLPHLANRPSSTTNGPLAANRIYQIRAFAQGLHWIEYPLIAFGTAVEGTLVLATNGTDITHVTLLGLYGALWLMLMLKWQKHIITGRIVTPRQEPVAHAVVRAEHAAGRHLHATTVTNADGRFRMRVHPGKYSVRVEKEDHASSSTELATQADAPAKVSLVLTPTNTVKPMPWLEGSKKKR